MAGIPDGITTALVHLDAPVSFIGEVGRIHATVTSNVPLVWAATGTPIGNFVDNVSMDPGVPLQLELPHTDQAGFLDGAGNALKGWAYRIEVTYERDGQTIPFPARDFQIVGNQKNVDLALIPSGKASAPVTAPQGTVMDVGGVTGSVTLAKLNLDKVENTPDVDKPVSKATAAELTKKADATEVSTELAKKVDSTAMATELTKKADATATAKALSALSIASQHTVNAESFGIVGDGVTDDTPALQAALNATANGQKLVIPGRKYKLTSPLTGSGKTCIIEAYGAEFIAAGNHGVLNWAGSYGTVHAVTKITPSTLALNDLLLQSTEITLSAAPSLVRGDVIKIVADDVVTGARPGEDGKESRIGEFAVVDSVSGTKVQVLGRLRETYTLNVRLAKMEKHSVHLRGLTASAADDNSTATLIGLVRLVAPTTNDVRIKSSGGSGIIPVGCYGYDFHNVTVDAAANEPATGHYGYGIMDNSCSYGNITNLRANRVRHAYSDDTPRIPANSALDNYGRTYGADVNGIAQGTTSTGFDTHHASENVRFINTKAIQCFAGYTLRGRKHSIINGFNFGGKNAVSVFTEHDSAETWGHTIDVTSEYTQETPISFYVNSTRGGRETRPSYIKRLRVNCPTYANAGIRTQNANIHIQDAELIAAVELPDSAKLISAQNAVVTMDRVVLDMRPNTIGATVAMFETTANSSLSGKNIRVLNTAESAGRSQMMRNASNDVIRLRDVEMDYRTGTSATTAAGDIIYEFLVGSSGERSNVVMQGSANIAVSLRRSDDPVFTAIISPSGSAPTLTALSPGRLPGQRLSIINVGPVGLVIPHAGGSLIDTDGDVSKTLVPGQTMNLVWTGTAWLQIVGA